MASLSAIAGTPHKTTCAADATYGVARTPARGWASTQTALLMQLRDRPVHQLEDRLDTVLLAWSCVLLTPLRIGLYVSVTHSGLCFHTLELGCWELAESTLQSWWH